MNAENSARRQPWDGPGRKNLGMAMVYCVAPLFESGHVQSALSVLNCVNILTPQSDTRQLQGLAHYFMGDYIEARQVIQGIEHMPAKALDALCQRAMGESSWLGAAEAIWEVGDTLANAMLAPWMDESFQSAAQHGTETRGNAKPDPQIYPFTPMRA